MGPAGLDLGEIAMDLQSKECLNLGRKKSFEEKISVFNDSLKKAKPLHGFKVGNHTIWVTEDDKRYERMMNDSRCKKI